MVKDSLELQNNLNKFFKCVGAKQAPPIKKSFESSILTGEIKPIEINKKTIVSEIIKLKVEGINKYYGNLVL